MADSSAILSVNMDERSGNKRLRKDYEDEEIMDDSLKLKMPRNNGDIVCGELKDLVALLDSDEAEDIEKVEEEKLNSFMKSLESDAFSTAEDCTSGLENAWDYGNSEVLFSGEEDPFQVPDFVLDHVEEGAYSGSVDCYDYCEINTYACSSPLWDSNISLNIAPV